MLDLHIECRIQCNYACRAETLVSYVLKMSHIWAVPYATPIQVSVTFLKTWANYVYDSSKQLCFVFFFFIC